MLWLNFEFCIDFLGGPFPSNISNYTLSCVERNRQSCRGGGFILIILQRNGILPFCPIYTFPSLSSNVWLCKKRKKFGHFFKTRSRGHIYPVHLLSAKWNRGGFSPFLRIFLPLFQGGFSNSAKAVFYRFFMRHIFAENWAVFAESANAVKNRCGFFWRKADEQAKYVFGIMEEIITAVSFAFQTVA